MESNPILELLEALGATEVEFMDLGDGDMAAVATIKSDELSIYKANAVLGSVIKGDMIEYKKEAMKDLMEALVGIMTSLRSDDLEGVEDESELVTHHAEDLQEVEDDKDDDKVEKALTSVITKDWKPFQGPRGGTGVYNPRTQQVEYGENAERRIRMETTGRKVESPYLDLDELVARLMNGQARSEDLDQSQLLAAYNHVNETIELGGAKPGYDQVKDTLAYEIQARGLEPSVAAGVQ